MWKYLHCRWLILVCMSEHVCPPEWLCGTIWRSGGGCPLWATPLLVVFPTGLGLMCYDAQLWPVDVAGMQILHRKWSSAHFTTQLFSLFIRHRFQISYDSYSLYSFTNGSRQDINICLYFPFLFFIELLRICNLGLDSYKWLAWFVDVPFDADAAGKLLCVERHI